MSGVKTCETFSIADSVIKGCMSGQIRRSSSSSCRTVLFRLPEMIEGEAVVVTHPHRVYERRRRAPRRDVSLSKRMSAPLPLAAVEDAFFCAEDAFWRPRRARAEQDVAVGQVVLGALMVL